MIQQGLIPVAEGCRIFSLACDCLKVVGPMKLRGSAEIPQALLQPFTETMEVIGPKDLAGFPVRIGQDKMVHQMIEGLSGKPDL